MPIQYTSYGRPRADLREAIQEMNPAQGFVTTQVLPVLGVRQKSAALSVLKRENYKLPTVAMADGDSYGRVQLHAKDSTFTCKKYGLEGPDHTVGSGGFGQRFRCGAVGGDADREPASASAGKYSLQISQRYDSIVEDAMQKGIGIQLVLQHHGQFSTTTNSNWNENPYNIANSAFGGFLTNPEDFFTNAEAKRLTKNKYRYIVARWGYCPAIFAWELWNEVQFTDGWNNNRPAVVAWHQEMADYIRSIDPHGHLITTSSDGSGFADIWNQANMDMVQFHQYGSPTIETYYGTVRGLQNNYNKPVMMAEFGISTDGSAGMIPMPSPNPGEHNCSKDFPFIMGYGDRTG